MRFYFVLLCVFYLAQVAVNGMEMELVKPRIPGKKFYVEEGEEVIMRCNNPTTKSIPTLGVWLGNKRLKVSALDPRIKTSNSFLPPQSGNVESVELHEVTISAVNFSDAGDYVCKEAGDSSTTFSLMLYVYRVIREDAVVGVNVSQAEVRCITEYSTNNTNYSNEQPKRVEWFKKKGANYTKVEEGDKIAISDMHDSLNISKIDRTTYDHVGEYMCQIQPDSGARTINYSVSINTAGGAVRPMQESTKGIQGDPKKISCNAFGYPMPQITWTVNGLPVELDQRKMTDPDAMTNSTLMFKPLEEVDHGEYTCHVSNYLGSGEATIVLRVKDRYAALWPFLGICAEVAILCAIIFFFERRRARKMQEEEQDPSAGDGLMNHREEELRQRKVQA